MAVPESSLVLLKSCGDPSEASALRALLDANGISCVVQGEQHRSMLGVMGGYIEVNVLVAAQDLERARELVDVPAGEAAEDAVRASSGAALETEDSICPVHGERSNATCTRCGTFLCARCQVSGSPESPVCEDCAERYLEGGEERRARRRRLAAWLVLAFLAGPTIVMGVVALLYRLLG